tara:strand:- start:1226 stop:1756 length:531 start_codon:yes stop_codon:yes gene_type:complete
MSTMYVDNIVEKTSTNGVHIPGHVIQVAQGTLGGRPNANSSSYVNSTLEVAITPKFITSKILVRSTFLFSQSRSPAHNQDHMKAFTIFRDSTNIAPHNSAFLYHQNEVGGTTSDFQEQTENVAIEILDSPATTSAITYSLRYKSDNPTTVTVVINGRGHGSGHEGSCIITAMEIAQ